ncbi:MAG: type II toxin-antitoxin system RelE/ParE family toxin [Elusimicrobia bacterium]|nr:type II toxin-antitoxin system RelE/ParE family toxin [Elusimicrobiota bacterium]
MRRLRVVYLRRARADLLEVFRYIERDSPAAARAWLDKLDKSLGRLAAFPNSGAAPKDERLAALGYRMAALGDYLAFYLVRRGRVEIRRVIHGSRRYSFLV